MNHLFLAIWEGIIEHRRALLKLAAWAVGLVLLLQVAFYFASSSPVLCQSCHIMKPFVDMWRNSSHKNVACVSCHSEYRFLLSQTYLKYALGFYTTQLRAEVPDERCLKCHERQNLDTDKVFLKEIHFSHQGHMGEMRLGKRLHCTSCHSGLVMGEGKDATHVGVDEAVCFTCHFKGAEQGQAVTGCLVCHGPPKVVVTHQGFEFDHGTYLQRGVRCATCHTEVTRGDANVPPERCSACHISRAESLKDSERIHEIHLKDHAIDCKRCHNRMEHGKFSMATALGERCENCHKPEHTAQEQMYIGIGGRGVPDMPSTMFLARVACDSCHAEPGSDPKAGAEKLRTSCVHCHGRGYDRMVDDWIRELGQLRGLVEQAVAQAEARARALGARGKRWLSGLEAARHNLQFIAAGRGEHNVRYAVELLRFSLEQARQVPGVEVPTPVTLATASGYCRVCHSVAHLSEPLSFGGLTYDHTRHLSAGIACETCHSVEEHGKTTIQAAQCMACHHSPAQSQPCGRCHEAQQRLAAGELIGTGFRGAPDPMAAAGVECTGCHDLNRREPLVTSVQKACVACHESGYDQMLVEWINEDQARLQELAVLLARAKAGKAAASEVAEAELLYNGLLKAKGVHNMDLASKAAARARSLLAPALKGSH
ncbi:MAG: hypothetical protein NZ869_09805 [Thermoanaerobaculum sp.]|nr:hypothetical protein [Thermoanaerobaculum sp.]MDW7967132.1 hypothetical protein [Thermoanaerobaculum sp.]